MHISAKEYVKSLKFDHVAFANLLIGDVEKAKSGLVGFSLQATDDAIENLIVLHQTLVSFYAGVYSLKEFDVMNRAFENMIDFVLELDKSAIELEDDKVLLSSLLISLLEDLKDWINIIFIDCSTDNIHYFDVSLISSCLNIEFIFNNRDIKEDNLDFFKKYL